MLKLNSKICIIIFIIEYVGNKKYTLCKKFKLLMLKKLKKGINKKEKIPPIGKSTSVKLLKYVENKIPKSAKKTQIIKADKMPKK